MLQVETGCSRLTTPRCSWRCGHAFRGGDVGSRYVRPFIPEEGVGPFTRVQKEKSGGRQRSISWWRGFWILWWQWGLTSVWLSMSFFGFFSGWISCYIIFLRHHGLSGSETSWAYFGTSIEIQGPKWFHELWEFKSYWKLLKVDQRSNLIKSDMVLEWGWHPI